MVEEALETLSGATTFAALSPGDYRRALEEFNAASTGKATDSGLPLVAADKLLAQAHIGAGPLPRGERS